MPSFLFVFLEISVFLLKLQGTATCLPYYQQTASLLSQNDINREKALSLFGYLGFLCGLVLLLKQLLMSFSCLVRVQRR